MKAKEKPKICWVVSSEMTVSAFLREQIRAAAAAYEVSVVVNTRDKALLDKLGLTARLRPVTIERRAAPFADLRALFALVRLFRAERFALVHSISPKAGLLAMVAARITGVRVRLHTFTGQVWATRGGAPRALLKSLDRLLAACATHLLADSLSQRAYLLAQGITPAGKISVLASGSISGVDLGRFRPDAALRAAVRAELALSPDACLFLYLGRLNLDKGVQDLAAAFARACQSRSNAFLVLVGPDEQGMRPRLDAIFGPCGEQVRYVGYTAEPERYCAAADVICLPSYREGFGLTIVEAAACGVPALASRIYGITDAVIEGETGLLHPPGDVEAIVQGIARLHDDAAFRQRLAGAALERVRREFSSERMTREVMALYDRLLAAGGGA